MKNVFVTVGTTEFCKLIQTITSPRCLRALKKRGCERLKLQIGNGEFVPMCRIYDGIEITHYRFKETIKEDLMNADFVVSHAGAGSCLETLELQKPLLVVINEDLMDNHQYEVAEKLSESHYLYYTTCDKLPSAIEEIDVSRLRMYPKRDPRIFAKAIDCIMGFTG